MVNFLTSDHLNTTLVIGCGLVAVEPTVGIDLGLIVINFVAENEMMKPCISKNWNVQESIETFIAVNARVEVM